MSGLLGAIDISAKGLSVQRQKMNVVAQNMANAETVQTPEGGPYRRQRVIVSEDKQTSSFDTLLNRANNRLVTTNSKHMSGRGQSVSSREDVSTVSAKTMTEDESNFKLVYDPGHPQADEEGYVRMPDIEVITEMVDMMAASRAYEANAAAISAAKRMVNEALDI